MSIANGQLLDLANQCLQGLDAVQPTEEKSKALATRLDYVRTVNGLLRQAKTIHFLQTPGSFAVFLFRAHGRTFG